MNKKTVKYIFFFFMLLVLFTNISTTHAFETIYDDFETTEAEWAGWTNVAGDSLFGNYGKQYDKEWEIRDGKTPSYYTGPDQASTGSKYIYLEASGSNNKTVYLEAVHLEAGTIIESIEFDYHMYGRNMGTLDLEYYDGIDETDGHWISVWNQTGQKQNSDIAPWEKVNIDLSAYKTNKVRFKGVTGKTYTSDIALDNITITTISNDNPLPIQPNELNRLKGYVAAQDIYLNSYKILNEPDSASLGITNETIEVMGSVSISKAMRLQPMDNPPANPLMGDIYVNISNALCVYMDGKWNKVTGTGTCERDLTAPALLTIEVSPDGKDVVLTYDETLDDSVVPSDSDFLISSSSNIPINVTDIDVNGPTVTLTLDRTIEGDETLTLNYAAGANPIQDKSFDGNDAGNLTNKAITNNSEQDVDDTPPAVTNAEISADGTTMIVTFDDNIKSTNFADAAGFTITGSPTVTVIGVTANETTKVILTLDTTIDQDVTNSALKLTYTQDGSNFINDDSDNALANFSDEAISNKSTVDQTSPLVTNIEIPASGTTIELTLDDIIQSTSFADAAGFTIIGSPTVIVTGVTADGTNNKVILTLDITIDKDVAGTALKLAYTQDASKLINDDGNNALANFSNEGITNTSTADGVPPSLQSATVPNAGTTIELTYDENLDTSSKPANSDFTISGSSLSAKVSSIDITGMKVTLTLDNPIGSGEMVTLDYTADTNPIQDGAENDAANLSAESIANSSTVTIPAITGNIGVPADLVYYPGAALKFTVNYDEAVNVTGKPQIEITDIQSFGADKHYAEYDSGSGTPNIVFTYIVKEKTGTTDATDMTDGIGLATTIDLNGGTMSNSGGTPASLDITTAILPSLTNVKLDAAMWKTMTDAGFVYVPGGHKNSGGTIIGGQDADGDTINEEAFWIAKYEARPSADDANISSITDTVRKFMSDNFNVYKIIDSYEWANPYVPDDDIIYGNFSDSNEKLCPDDTGTYPDCRVNTYLLTTPSQIAVDYNDLEGTKITVKKAVFNTPGDAPYQDISAIEAALAINDSQITGGETIALPSKTQLMQVISLIVNNRANWIGDGSADGAASGKYGHTDNTDPTTDSNRIGNVTDLAQAGKLFQGHSDNSSNSETPQPANTDDQGYYNTVLSSGSIIPSQRRTYVISNNLKVVNGKETYMSDTGAIITINDPAVAQDYSAVIWDFTGNVSEWTKDLISAHIVTGGTNGYNGGNRFFQSAGPMPYTIGTPPNLPGVDVAYLKMPSWLVAAAAIDTSTPTASLLRDSMTLKIGFYDEGPTDAGVTDDIYIGYSISSGVLNKDYYAALLHGSSILDKLHIMTSGVNALTVSRGPGYQGSKGDAVGFRAATTTSHGTQ